jgi:NADH:ubiquinone oxidoreductase subunit 5 (subunit L)/multisubunit Na+/H+ antiporter MnhA subunit
MLGEQDIRRMGALSKIAPYVYMNILVASLALAGTPFLAGFYSKDLIIEIANTKFIAASQCIY